MKTKTAPSDRLLFEEQEISRSPLERFASTIREEPEITLSAVCGELYGRWERQYAKFRTIEQQALYSAAPGSDPPAARPATARTLAGHRYSIANLFQKGESLDVVLDQIASELDENQKSEIHDIRIHLGALLESLRESLELWHPANPATFPDSLSSIFGDEQ